MDMAEVASQPTLVKHCMKKLIRHDQRLRGHPPSIRETPLRPSIVKSNCPRARPSSSPGRFKMLVPDSRPLIMKLPIMIKVSSLIVNAPCRTLFQR